MELLKIALQDSGRIAASLAKTSGGVGMKQEVAVAAPTATRIAMDILRKKGFSGLYQGGVSTLTRDVFFSSIYFPLFAYFNSKVSQIPFFRPILTLILD
jgi:hypothetical protein